MAKVMISSQEDTRFKKCSENDEVIQTMESRIENLKSIIKQKNDALQKKEIELQGKQEQITELTQLNISLQKDVINIHKDLFPDLKKIVNCDVKTKINPNNEIDKHIPVGNVVNGK
ncbi:PREDICTED: uncharacterized protein LOC105460068, partial [Wasmannia auropunctata]|uniref:uncharacterized protein LOC105460068 n=1 Tax=Wasmannia auropunctata TaxID=64793 RepID=UPI0005EE8460